MCIRDRCHRARQGTAQLPGRPALDTQAAVGALDGQALEGFVALGPVGEDVGEGRAAGFFLPDHAGASHGRAAVQGDAVVFDAAESVGIRDPVPAVALSLIHI